MATHVIPTAALVQYCDALTEIYLAARGANPAGTYEPSNPNNYGLGLGDGVWGAGEYVTNLLNSLITAAGVGITGLDSVAFLTPSVSYLQGILSTKSFAQQWLARPLAALRNQVIQSTTSFTLDAYLTSLNCNGVTDWQALMPVAFTLLASDAASMTISQQNIWYEVLLGSQYAHGLGSLNAATSVFTVGVNILSVGSYAGGFPYLNVSGLTGSGLVTVTGTAFNPANVGTSTSPVVSSVTWTATVTANGLTALVPGGGSAAPANSLILSVSGIAAAGGVSAGTITVEAHRPAGRNQFLY